VLGELMIAVSKPLLTIAPMTRTPPRVLLMAHSLGLGGSERQLAEIAMALDRTAVEPLVAAFNATGERADDLARAGVPVLEFPLRSFVHPSAVATAASFVRWLRRERVSVVHPFDVPSVMFAVPLARLARVPLVVSSQRGDRALFPAAYRRVLRLTDLLADAVVVNSSYIARLLTTRDGVPARRVHACPNGVDTSRFRPGHRARPDGLSAEGLVIGTVAVLRPEKSIATLVEAFARLGESPHRLVIVGDGPCKPDLVALAERLGVADRCLFTGPTRTAEDWYRRIDVFVLPSLNESFSNALLEAMACGCCVVASAVGGNVELIRDGQNGRLFAVGDEADLARCLESLLASSETRDTLAWAAVRTIEAGYTTHAAGRRMAEIYRSLLASTA
jgi:glycosyltransferase involved in cell wall biosynthesis